MLERAPGAVSKLEDVEEARAQTEYQVGAHRDDWIRQVVKGCFICTESAQDRKGCQLRVLSLLSVHRGHRDQSSQFEGP